LDSFFTRKQTQCFPLEGVSEGRGRKLFEDPLPPFGHPLKERDTICLKIFTLS
jgi:hypothetical protein